MLKRISITGPESTGKSTLARQLASHFDTVWVSEYAVDYLTDHGPAYNMQDVLKIARIQLEHENNMTAIAKDLLFCDTDMLVHKIWCDVVFGDAPAWIEQQVRTHLYDLYLICSPDIPWKPGSFRENPKDRDYLFELYLRELSARKLNYRIVKGSGKQRLANAIHFVNELSA